MELWRFYRILRRRKWLIIIGTLICVGIVVAGTRMSAEKYEAVTTIMEKMSTENTVDIFPGYAFQIDPKIRLANLAQLVRSRTVMERSAQTLFRLNRVADPTKILQSLTVTPVMDTTILSIKVQSDSEADAKATADVVAKEFITYYSELNSSGAAKSKQFIESELPKAESRLNQARERLRRFKEQNKVVQLDQQTGMLMQQMSTYTMSLSQSQVRANEASARVNGLEEKLRDTQEFPEKKMVSKAITTNPIWLNLQQELGKEEIELQAMLRRRTEEHPEVQALRRRMAETQRQLHETEASIVSSQGESSNPIRDNLTQQYVGALVDHAAAAAAANAAQEQMSALQPKLDILPDKEAKLAQLTLDMDNAKYTYQLLRQKLDEAAIKEKEAENSSAIQIVDPAKTAPADKQKGMKLILAIILSPVFCSGVALLLNYLDNSVKTPAEAEELLQMPIFAVVPLTRAHILQEKKSLPVMDTSFQMLSTNLWFGTSEMQGNTVLVASAEPDVGRSSVAANLAITLAKDGARVIMVDADLRQPSQHLIFNIENEKGLSNVLAGQLSLTEALKPTSYSDLLLLPSGPLPSNPIRLFRTEEMQKFVNGIGSLADYVIFDSPAGITFADATLLAALVKNVVIVYAAGTVPRGAEVEFRGRLEQVEANLLGAVLNMVNPEDSHGFHHFRVGYEELLRNGKGAAVPAERMLKPVPDDSSEKVEETHSSDS